MNNYRQTRKALKAARKLMRVYAQQPFNWRGEDRRYYVRKLEDARLALQIALMYRNCWQYGRHVHGAVSETKQGYIALLRSDMAFFKRMHMPMFYNA